MIKLLDDWWLWIKWRWSKFRSKFNWSEFKDWLIWQGLKRTRDYQALQLLVDYGGEQFEVNASHVVGRHIACSDNAGKYPEGLLVEIGNAVNRHQFRAVYKALSDQAGQQFFWPDGSKVDPNDLCG